jgi:hypothetical protein
MAQDNDNMAGAYDGEGHMQTTIARLGRQRFNNTRRIVAGK